MKKLIVGCLLATLLISPVWALEDQEATPSSRAEKIQLLKDRAEARHEEVQQAIESRHELVKAKISERTKIRLRNLFNLTKHRLEAAIARLTNLIERLESRLAKMEENGHETAEIQASLDEAREKLVEAQELVDLATTSFEDVLESEEPAKNFTDLREFSHEVHLLLKEAKEIIREALHQTKLALKEGEEATSSAQN